MAQIASWHRVLRYGGLFLGIAHGDYAFKQLSVIRAAERKEEIGKSKFFNKNSCTLFRDIDDLKLSI